MIPAQTLADPDPPAAATAHGVLRSSLIYSGLTLISRVMGFLRDLVITAAMGASSTIIADCYNTALSFPNLFRRIFAEGAFTAAFVPAYARTLEAEGADAADQLARDALATLAALTLGATLIAELAMPILMRGLGAGFLSNPEKFKLAVILSQITLPYLPAMTLVALMSGVLNARGRFIVSAAVPTLLNAVMLAVVLPARTPTEAAYAACWGVLLAGAAQVCLLIWGVRRTGAKLGAAWPTLNPEIRGLILLAVPGALAAAATQINVFVAQVFASGVEGGRSWMNVADRLYQLPLGLVGVAIGVALLPALSRAVQRQDAPAAQGAMDDAVVMAMAFTAPCAAAMLAMPDYLIDGLFRRGAFNSFDARQTAGLLFHYGWGVPAFVLTRVMTPAFFARADTRRPMRFAAASIALNAGLGLGLSPVLGPVGLVIGVSVAAWLNVALMAGSLWRAKTWRPSPAAAARLLRIAAAGLGMAALCALAQGGRGLLEAHLPHVGAIGPKEIGVLLVCIAGAIAYIGLAFAFGALRLGDLKALKRAA